MTWLHPQRHQRSGQAGRFVFFLMLTVVIVPAGAHADSFPQVFEAVYIAHRNELLLGETRRTLRRDDQGTYVYTSRTRSKGWLAWLVKIDIEEISRWRWQNQQMIPLHYEYHRSAPKTKHMTLDFDWKKKQLLRRSRDRDQQQMAIPANTIDKHLLPLAIARDLSFAMKELHYTVADGHQIKTYAFEIVGRETLTLPAGEFSTLRLRRDSPKQLDIWIAPALGYLPVRLVSHNDDDDSQLRLTLKTIHFPAEVAAATPAAIAGPDDTAVNAAATAPSP